MRKIMPESEVISRTQIVRLCAKALRLYDDRLVDHGERVAFLARRIAEQMKIGLFDEKKLMILSIFHDVGAYKTEEIDRMVEFETANVQAHSIYGYLFLKYFTPIGALAQAVLYHHTDERKLDKVDSEIRQYASLLHLADRADIAIMGGCPKEHLIDMLSSPQFNAEMISALERALLNTSVYEDVREGRAIEFIIHQIPKLSISIEESLQYLKMLVYSIDFKSKYTVVHSVNTTVISLYLAWYSGLKNCEMERIYYAALIHDVGKMAIPESILENPGKLNDEEMQIMRKHVTYTKKIIDGIVPEDIMSIAVKHHEKLDGSGYPEGLSGEQLSISDRIVAVSDILSALLSRRSYKGVFDKEKTLDIINEMSLKGQLDSKVVTLVNDRYDDMIQCVEQYTAPIYYLYEELQKEYAVLMESAILRDETSEVFH